MTKTPPFSFTPDLCAGLPQDQREIARQAGGYDPDVALAQHLVHDCGQATPWALDALGIAIDWDSDDGRMISDCGRYEIAEDPAYGVASLFVDDVLESEGAGIGEAKRLARQHKALA